MAGSGELGSVQIIADQFDIAKSGDLIINFVEYIEIGGSDHFALVE